jgi:ribonuclease-3
MLMVLPGNSTGTDTKYRKTLIGNYMLFWKKEKDLKNELFQSVKKCIGYSFRKKDLLLRSLTHSSARKETDGNNTALQLPHLNERLEFLGDAVLGLVISEVLYAKFTQMTEGRMSIIKSHLVSREVLAKKCRSIGLDKLIIAGKGIKEGVLPVSVLANAMESLFGAIFLEAGYKEINKVITKIFAEDIPLSEDKARYSNYKALLQDYSQQHFTRVPVYKVVKQSGPKHKPLFEVMVYLPANSHEGRTPYGPGIGNDKKSAEQSAARIALEKLGLLV